MVRGFKLIRRSAKDIRNLIKIEWIPLLSELLTSEHYPIVLCRYYEQADINKTKSESDRREVDVNKPNYRIYCGHQHWEYLTIVPDKLKHASMFDHYTNIYEKEQPIKRVLSAAVETLNEQKWTDTAKEIYELFTTSNHKKRPKGDLYLEQMLVIQPENIYFLVRNQAETGEFIVLDVDGADCSESLYETDTAYEVSFGFSRDYALTRYHAMNWPEKYERNFLGLQKEPEITIEDKETRIRKDIAWVFDSHYAPSINSVLRFAVSKLELLGESIGIAASDYRFNDAGNDSGWMAVRLGEYAWENGSYFDTNTEHLYNMPDKVRVMLGIVTQLVASRLSGKFTESFGYKLEPLDVWGICKQEGKWLFAISSSNGYDGAVYEIHPPTGELTFLGLVGRFDWAFGTIAHTPKSGGQCEPIKILNWITVDQWLERLKSGKPHWDIEIKYYDLIPNG